MLHLAVLIAAAASIEPIGAELAAALSQVAADPEPEEITRGNHYFSSNEWRLEHFLPVVRDLGGTYIGVGADQNYLIAGWMRPELVVLTDFDQAIVDLHGIYRVVFTEADTPADFFSAWTTPRRHELYRLIRAAHPPGPKRRQLLAVARVARHPVWKRLTEVREQHDRQNVQSFLNNPEQYAYVAALVRAGRVVAVRGDLTADQTFKQLGAALHAQGQVVRALYMSNAEQYFGYKPGFRANMRGLPTDQRSQVLRTRPTGLDYTYVLQSYSSFLGYLALDHVRSVRDLAPRRALSPRRPTFEVPLEPPAAKQRRSRVARLRAP